MVAPRSPYDSDGPHRLRCPQDMVGRDGSTSPSLDDGGSLRKVLDPLPPAPGRAGGEETAGPDRVDEKLEPPDPKKTGLAGVLRGAERIESLVRELLLFSREETFKLEKLDPIPLLNDAVESAGSSWGGKVELEKETGTLVKADEEKLRRVFLNGVQNAIQAMGEEGTLRVSVRRAGRWIKVRMEDTGPGIPEAEMARLFTPFHTTKTDGTGLGLAYSKKVVEGMGGRISLQNRDRKRGAVLSVQLPRTGE
jgi:signal transduction histidine kinase